MLNHQSWTETETILLYIIIGHFYSWLQWVIWYDSTTMFHSTIVRHFNFEGLNFEDQELSTKIILFSENFNMIIKWPCLHHRPQNGFVKIFIKENIPSFSKIGWYTISVVSMIEYVSLDWPVPLWISACSSRWGSNLPTVSYWVRWHWYQASWHTAVQNDSL